MEKRPPKIKFGVIGLNHFHIHAMTEALLQAGAELAGYFAIEPDLCAEFDEKFPQARRAHLKTELLDDAAIALIVSAAIPCERAPLGIEVMRRGKDFLSDKAGFTNLAQLAEVKLAQAETGRIYSVYYGERFENKATYKAGELARAGAIGRVIQTIGTGPHKLNEHIRPAWFFKKIKCGGIICDIGSHQMEQFLYFTNSTKASIVCARAANLSSPKYPELQDFGEVILQGDGGSAYFRIDWLAPASLPVFGDTRCTVLGTDGYMEIRKHIDICGRGVGAHLFLVDKTGPRHIPTDDVELPFIKNLLHDVAHRTETAMSQAHCYLASELALQAQDIADGL